MMDCGTWRLVFCALICGAFLASATVTTREKHDEFAQKVNADHNKDGHHSKNFDHDVIWGDGKTSENDNGITDDDVENLSSEEKMERLRLLVQQRIDKDKDGYVSLEELTAWTERSYDLFEGEETKEIFPDVDRNKDGAIQWQEYAEDTYGAGFTEDSDDFKNPPSVEWQEFVNTYKKEKKKFEAADLDGNKQLSLSEYQIFKHPRQNPKMEHLLIEETLEASDLNKDGGIDVEEFIGDFEKKEGGSDPHWTVMEREKFQDELDLDKDGVLKGEEILQWVAPNNRALAIEEAEHLMDETDLDHDDKLSVEEIVNNHADWVDSDATDYGRQLLKHHDEL